MANPGQTIAIVGALGVGGYLFYEYNQYSNAMNTLFQGNAAQIAAAQQVLPFFTYLSLLWGGSGTTTQVQGYQAIQAVLTGSTGTSAGSTPGTTSSTQPTSVSTVSTTTPSTSSTSSTAPATTAPQPPAPAPLSNVPATSLRPLGMALHMQNAIQMTVANADQWNYAYRQVAGQGIEQTYGFAFDKVYGPVVRGVRSSGAMSAEVFLQMAVNGQGMSGFGAIAQYAGPALLSQGNMIYMAHHPFPYSPTYTLRGLKGLSGVVQASGFEKALFARQPLMSNKLR